MNYDKCSLIPTTSSSWPTPTLTSSQNSPECFARAHNWPAPVDLASSPCSIINIEVGWESVHAECIVLMRPVYQFLSCSAALCTNCVVYCFLWRNVLNTHLTGGYVLFRLFYVLSGLFRGQGFCSWKTVLWPVNSAPNVTGILNLFMFWSIYFKFENFDSTDTSDSVLTNFFLIFFL